MTSTGPMEDESRGAMGAADTTAVVTLEWDRDVGPQPIGFGPEAEPIVLDWFGLGEPDLLVTARVGPLGRRTRIYRPLPVTRDGAPLLFDEGRDLPELDGLRLPCPIPNGRESRFDLVAMAPEGLVLLPNRGDELRPEFRDRILLNLALHPGPEEVRVRQMLPIDWDGDGRVDLVLGLDDLEGYWPDPGVPIAQQVGLDDGGSHPGYDPSGRWRGRAPIGRLCWFRNVSDEGAIRFEGPEPIDAEGPLAGFGARPAAVLVSWGASQAVEVVATDAKGVVRFYRNFGGQLPPVLLEPRPLIDQEGRPLALPEDRTTLSAADLDLDRRSELVFGTSEGRIFAVHAGKNRDSGTVLGPILQEGHTLRLGGGASLTVGDLDGDGGIDLLAGDASGRLHWYLDRGAAGDHRYGPPEEVEAGGLPFRIGPGIDGRLLGPIEPPWGFSCPLLVDWKVNGRPDLLVGGRGGNIHFLRNNGHATQPRFDLPEPLRCERRPLVLPPRVRPAAADWFGTGLPDLLAPDSQGFLCVWRRVDTLGLAPPEPLVDRFGRLIRIDGAFGLGGHCSLWAGDWTGSGRPDLLLGLPVSSRFVVPAMTGEPLDRLEDVPNVVLLENVGDGVVIPRPIRFADGSPLIVPEDACSPNGVDWSGRGSLDLLVGAGSGSVQLIPRALLRW